MTQLGESMLAAAVLGLAYEVWMMDNVASGIQLFTAAALAGLLLAALGRWRQSHPDDGLPPAM